MTVGSPTPVHEKSAWPLRPVQSGSSLRMMQERSDSCNATAGFLMQWLLWELCQDQSKAMLPPGKRGTQERNSGVLLYFFFMEVYWHLHHSYLRGCNSTIKAGDLLHSYFHSVTMGAIIALLFSFIHQCLHILGPWSTLCIPLFNNHLEHSK